MPIVKSFFVACFAIILLQGCASIFNGSTQTFAINTTPSDARITITNRAGKQVYAGRSPGSVTLEKGRGYFKSEVYKVRIEKEYCETTEIYLTPRVSGWYFANFAMFGGLWGLLIIDPLTGAMYTLSPEQIDEKLPPWGSGQSAAEGSLNVVLLEDVPPALMQSAKRLN